MSRLLLVALLIAASAQAAASAAPEPDDAARVEKALAYIASRQNVTGRWDLMQDGLPSQGYVAEAASAAGKDPKVWPTPQKSAYAVLAPESGEGIANPTDRADRVYKTLLRVAHAAGVSGYDPRGVHGRDLVEAVRAGFVGGQFGDARYVNDDAFAILALRAAGVPASDPQIRAAVDNLYRSRALDGGWSYSALSPTRGDVDSTGIVLAALRAAGENTLADDRARAFLAENEDPETGGFRMPGATQPNCQSTVWGIHARHALGLPSDRALAFLRSLQQTSGDGGFKIQQNGRSSNLFCTVEATVVLAGARFPMPSFAPASGAPASVRALERVTPVLPGPFNGFAWTWDRADVTDHGDGSFTFPAAGGVGYRVVARGDGVVHRASGVLTVLSAPPALSARLSHVETFRNASVELDASGSRDPDGSVARLTVEWGDGAVSEGSALRASHSYRAVGNHSVAAYVTDDAGVRSEVFSGWVEVRNRAPRPPALPARLVADRVSPVELPWDASDPDGDAVVVSWREGERSGDSPVLRFERLGEHEVHVKATDALGASASAALVVEVVNRPPVLADLALPAAVRSGEEVRFSVNASDPDGPAPRVEWTFGERGFAGSAGSLLLPAGAHNVTVTATDADGGRRTLTSTLVVGSDPEPVPLLRVEGLSARLHEGRLVVAFAPPPPGASALVAWTSDAGEGEAQADGGRVEVPLDATEVRVRVTLRLGALSASAETEPLRAPRAPLEAPAILPVAVVEGEPSRVAASVVRGAARYRFELGDGTIRDDLSAPEVVHAWERPGSYEVRVTAFAQDGRASSASALVTVASKPAPPSPATALPAVQAAPAPAPAEVSAGGAGVVTSTDPGLPASAPVESPRRESPGPAPLLAPLLAWALLRRRGRLAA